MENNKRKNVYIVIFVITTIIAACVAVYFGVMKNNCDKEINELTANIQNNTNEDTADNNCDDNVKVVEKEKVVYQNARPTFDATKCINEDSNFEYNLENRADFNGVTCLINKYTKGANLSISWNTVKEDWGINKPNGVKEDYQSIEINNFNQEILDMNIYVFGHESKGATIVFLMKDGTVEYIPVYKALMNNDFKSYGKISELKDIVEISGGECSGKIGGGYASIFAIKQDGSFYNLQPILLNTGNFYFD